MRINFSVVNRWCSPMSSMPCEDAGWRHKRWSFIRNNGIRLKQWWRMLHKYWRNATACRMPLLCYEWFVICCHGWRWRWRWSVGCLRMRRKRCRPFLLGSTKSQCNFYCIFITGTNLYHCNFCVWSLRDKIHIYVFSACVFYFHRDKIHIYMYFLPVFCPYQDQYLYHILIFYYLVFCPYRDNKYPYHIVFFYLYFVPIETKKTQTTVYFLAPVFCPCTKTQTPCVFSTCILYLG